MKQLKISRRQTTVSIHRGDRDSEINDKRHFRYKINSISHELANELNDGMIFISAFVTLSVVARDLFDLASSALERLRLSLWISNSLCSDSHFCFNRPLS